MQYVDLGDVHVARAHRVSLPGWMQPIMESQHQTLMAAGEEGGRRIALLSFSLEESDWPLRLSFPVAVRNLLTYLTPDLSIGSSSLIAGQSVQLYPAPGTQEIRILRPDGHTDRLVPVSGFLTGAGTNAIAFPPFSDTGEPGVYVVREIEAGRQITVPFAVNAFGARTRTATATGPDVLRFRAPSGGAGTGKSSAPEKATDSLAWAACLLVLALLGAEWWYGLRR
jgi:hypothetical protein